MCWECWAEDGYPSQTSPAIQRAAQLVRKVYGHWPTGGPMHVVIDDWNLDDGSVRGCRDAEPRHYYPQPYDAGPPENFGKAMTAARELADLLLAMPEPDRAAALAHFEGWPAIRATMPDDGSWEPFDL